MKQPRVVIVGAGFSGTMVACRLIEQSSQPLSILMLEKSNQPGRGLAYSTENMHHLLNVRASGMSAYPERPGHFAGFAFSKNRQWTGDSFVPRNLYGEYLTTILAKACEQAEQKSIEFEIKTVEATSIERLPASARLAVRLYDNTTEEADLVVLALGNIKPRQAVISMHPGSSINYIDDPWKGGVFSRIGNTDNVLIVGTGLTAIDQIIQLLDGGHTGRIHAVSRHGRLPAVHSHKATPGTLQESLPAIPANTLQAFQLVRQLIAKQSEWRDVIDALRPITQGWWQSLDAREQSRFNRHLRSLWDSHRHRMAPEIDERIRDAVARGQLVFHAGRFAQPSNSDVGIGIKPRTSGDTITLEVSSVINCTGPGNAIEQLDSGLLHSMRASGLAVPAKSDGSLAMDAQGRLIDQQGQVQGNLIALGPLRKGQLLESIAVPELKEQARDVAALILQTLSETTKTSEPDSLLPAQS